MRCASFLDGVCVADEQSLRFLPLPAPTRVEVGDTARRTGNRIEETLRAHGRSPDPEQGDAGPVKLQLEHPVLAALYDAAARGIAVSGGRHTLRDAVGIPHPAELRSGGGH